MRDLCRGRGLGVGGKLVNLFRLFNGIVYRHFKVGNLVVPRPPAAARDSELVARYNEGVVRVRVPLWFGEGGG